MLSDTPWKGLGQGVVDSRRVDHAGKWNFFWAIMPREDPALALVLRAPPIPAPKLPKLRSLETGFASLTGGPAFYLRLKDHAQLELFETLCRDVVDCAKQTMTEADALTRAIERARGSRLFGHFGDYAAIMLAGDAAAPVLFSRPIRHLIDERLLSAYARMLARTGDRQRAEFVVARAREYPPDAAFANLPPVNSVAPERAGFPPPRE